MAKLTNRLQYKFDKGFNESLKAAIEKGLFWHDFKGWLYFDGENLVEGEPNYGAVYLDIYVIPEHGGSEGRWSWPRRINCYIANNEQDMVNRNIIYIDPPIPVTMDPKNIKRGIAINVAMALGLKV